MTRLQLLLGLGVCLATPAMAWEQVLIDHDKPAQNWRVTSEELGIDSPMPFSVSMRTLHGGRQEGVSLIEIDNGTMQITVVPTRGMNVLEAVAGEVRLGWDSPVDEVVNPAFIELNGRGGLGWLEGFNELVTRCGFEWVGHPGEDNGELLTLHGRAANIPASRVVLQIDEKPPYAIRLRGELQEKAFKKLDFAILTELLPPSQLVKANGWIEGLTIASIILGVLIGGQLVGPYLSAMLLAIDLPGLHTGIDRPAEAAIAMLVGVYALAAAFNLRIPLTGVTPRPMPRNPLFLLQDFWLCNSRLWRDHLGQISLSTTTLFWGVSGNLRYIVLAWAGAALGYSTTQASSLVGVVALGTAVGAVVASLRMKLDQATRVMPLGVAMGVLASRCTTR